MFKLKLMNIIYLHFIVIMIILVLFYLLSISACQPKIDKGWKEDIGEWSTKKENKEIAKTNKHKKEKISNIKDSNSNDTYGKNNIGTWSKQDKNNVVNNKKKANKSLKSNKDSYKHNEQKIVNKDKKNTVKMYQKTNGVKWAVVIGISNYKDSRFPELRYADVDARSFANWLTSSEGGQYAPSRVKVLINKKATEQNIENVIFEWLQKPQEEDTVVVYFAGHGTPESPENKENLYLVPHNANYEKIASTCFPMWDIRTALKRHIKAKNVIIITDACHSGGVGKSFNIARRSGRSIDVNPVSSKIKDLSNIERNICIITASSYRGYSQEGKQWGGGHGVFTYYLLKGLNGKADTDNNDYVTLGEIGHYVSQHVEDATNHKQSPSMAGKFDLSMPIENR